MEAYRYQGAAPDGSNRKVETIWIPTLSLSVTNEGTITYCDRLTPEKEMTAERSRSLYEYMEQNQINQDQLTDIMTKIGGEHRQRITLPIGTGEMIQYLYAHQLELEQQQRTLTEEIEKITTKLFQ